MVSTAQRAIANSGWRVWSPSLTRLRSSKRFAPSPSTRSEPNGSSPSSSASRANSTQRRRCSRSSSLMATGRSLRSRGFAPAGKGPGQRIAAEPDQQRAEVADVGEVAFDGQHGGEDDQRGDDVEPPPPGGNVIGEYADDADDEVADPDVARVDQPRGGDALLDPPEEIALAQIRGADVTHETHDQPSPPAQPALGRCEEQREDDQVGPPVLAV